MKKIIAVFFALALLGAQCNPDRGIPRPKPFTDDDPSFCPAACEHVADLGCFEGKPLVYEGEECSTDSDCAVGSCKEGLCTETCEEFCVSTIQNGRWLGAECWTTVKECSEIETVCRR